MNRNKIERKSVTTLAEGEKVIEKQYDAVGNAIAFKITVNASKKVTITDGYIENYHISWGDGSFTKKEKEHTYSNAGNYTLIIYNENQLVRKDTTVSNIFNGASINEIEFRGWIDLVGPVFKNETDNGTITTVKNLYDCSSTGVFKGNNINVITFNQNCLIIGEEALASNNINQVDLSNVKFIDKNAFNGSISSKPILGTKLQYLDSQAFSSAVTLYYLGTAEQWTKLNTDSTNTVKYYSKDKPSSNHSDYWHYNDSGVAVIWQA